MPQKNNVYSTATIVRKGQSKEVDEAQSLQTYQLGTFLNDTTETNQDEKMQQVATLSQKQTNGYVDPVLNEIQALSQQLQSMQAAITTIQTSGTQGRDIDKQVIEAIKDLKNYASFFEQATFQLENKILKTSMAIAKKIITIEVGENSSKIAHETIKNLMNKVKTASKVQIHLNPKDYVALKDMLKLDAFVELHEDINVMPGGVVIASDLGNFDGNIEAKVNSMLESLESVL
jgi:flagellar assembly protein FliH